MGDARIPGMEGPEGLSVCSFSFLLAPCPGDWCEWAQRAPLFSGFLVGFSQWKELAGDQMAGVWPSLQGSCRLAVSLRERPQCPFGAPPQVLGTVPSPWAEGLGMKWLSTVAKSRVLHCSLLLFLTAAHSFVNNSCVKSVLYLPRLGVASLSCLDQHWLRGKSLSIFQSSYRQRTSPMPCPSPHPTGLWMKGRVWILWWMGTSVLLPPRGQEFA